MKRILLTMVFLLIAVTAASAQWTPAPSAVIAGAFVGFDHKVPVGQTAYNWLGLFTAVKTKTLMTDRIWLYTGLQYGNALTGNTSDNWGGNARVVFKGRENWPGTYFWLSSGWYNHIAQAGESLESGITVYAGGSIDLGTGFNLMGEYGWADRGPTFASQVRIGIGVDAWGIVTGQIK